MVDEIKRRTLLRGPALSGPHVGEILAVCRSGDLLSFRGRGCTSARIQREGRCPYSHSAMVYVDAIGRVFILEVREWYGGRMRLLADEVRRRPGRIDLFLADDEQFPNYRGDAAAAYFIDNFTGCDYGWPAIFRVSASRTRGLRLLLPPLSDDDERIDLLPFCSDAVNRSAAHEEGGTVDPVPLLHTTMTEPCDLARSRLWRRGAIGIVPDPPHPIT